MKRSAGRKLKQHLQENGTGKIYKNQANGSFCPIFARNAMRRKIKYSVRSASRDDIMANLDQKVTASISVSLKRPACLKMCCNRPRHDSCE